MLLDICFGTRSSWKILFVLCEAPGKAVSKKEIRDLTKIGNKVINKFIDILKKFDIVTSSKIGKTNYYKINMNSQFAEKIIDIIKLEKKILNNPDFKSINILREFVYEMTNINFNNVIRIILFGSYAKRTYNSESDIDVAIILENKDNDDELIIAETIEKLRKRFKKEIQLHYYTSKEFKELGKKSKLVQEIMKDGIELV